MASVAILIPLMRPHKIAPLVENINETTNEATIIVIASGECADASRDLPAYLIEDEGGTYPQRINRAFAESIEPYVMLAADDLWFHAGWLDGAMMAMSRVDGVVAVNDLHNQSGTHFLVSRNYVNTLGGCIGEPGVVLHEGYLHCWCDNEIRETAQFHERYENARDSVVEHMHRGAGKSPSDDIYEIGFASMSQGYEVYRSRSHLWAR